VPALSFLEGELERLAELGLYRDPTDVCGRRAAEEAAGRLQRPFIDVSSNDYLGYARAPVSRETLNPCQGLPGGAGASRLIHGSDAAQLALETELADWVGLPSALLFTSGYGANAGLIPALAQGDDLIVSDALNHASIIDGCRLSRARTVIVPHVDRSKVEQALAGAQSARRRWVVTESYFSMDGDSPDLRALRELCDAFDAGLIVDEAHALGVFGPGGAGLCRAAGVFPDVLVGTLSKAIGVQGAFVAGPPALRDWLWNRARTFVFSTGISPLLCSLIHERVRSARADDTARAGLLALAETLRARLAPGVRVGPNSRGPILPILIGDPRAAVAAARELQRQGILAQAIRPPTVPEGTSRLRVALSSRLTETDLDVLARALNEVCSDAR
jgi:8-amino-7-oxononanoate synthase